MTKRPRESRALHMLGVAYSRLERYREAEGVLQRARALKPLSTQILNDLADVLIRLGRDADALTVLEKVLKREPELRTTSFYMGGALANLGRYREAAEVFGQLAKLEPDNDLYVRNYGAALSMLHHFEAAEAVADQLLKRRTMPWALLLKAYAAYGLGSFARAIAIYDRLLTDDPTDVEAAYNRGFIRLLTGDFAAGWPDHEARLRREGMRVNVPCAGVPHWSSEPLVGKSLLVYAEQGLGDVIFVSRYLPLLVEMGCEVSFLVNEPMFRLLRGVSDRVHFITAVAPGQTFDFQIPMMSLPLRFATTLATVPPRIPYLFAEPEKVSHWRSVIGSEGFKIGIAWQGNPTFGDDAYRSIPVAAFAPLSQIPGARLISLQKNVGLEQLAALPAGMKVEELDSSGKDGFIDSAAVMSCMDMIVTSDTSIANLAGALGLPACVVLKPVPDWRWLADGDRTPWFPTLKLFRRRRDQEWREVIEAVAREAERKTKPLAFV